MSRKAESLFLELGDEIFLVQVAHERRLDHQIAKNGEESGEPQRGADQKHQNAQEGDARVQEREVAVDV